MTASPCPTRKRVLLWGLGLLSLLAALALYGFAAWFGTVNQDEGWYLYASRLVGEGKMPYRDFFYTQGPVLPYVYGFLESLWSPHGLLGGRLFTALLGILSAVFTAAMARRAVSPERRGQAGVIAFALIACNLYQAYFTTLPKTYALAALLLSAGYWILTFSLPGEEKPSSLASLWALPAGLLIALAAGTRLSLGLLLPITTLGLLFTVKRSGMAFFCFAVGGAAGLIAAFGPALIEAREAFVFSQTYHTSRGGYDLFLIAGSLSRIVRAYLPLGMLVCCVLFFCGLRRKWRPEEEDTARNGTIWPWIWLAGALSVFTLHLLAPHPYDDYQVPVMGLLTATFAAWLVTVVNADPVRCRLTAFWVFAALLTAFGSPLAQDWFVSKLDTFWVVRKERPDLVQMRDTARAVKELAGEESLLLTQDLYLAVEAGMRVPEGLEMGPFSYFPALTDEEAAKYHVMNRKGLLDLLAKAPCRVAAYSGYGWAIRCPEGDRIPTEDRQRFLSLLGRNYDYVKEIPDFGQNSTTLLLLSRRDKTAGKPVQAGKGK